MEGRRSCSDGAYVKPFARQNETDQPGDVLVIFNDEAGSLRHGAPGCCLALV